MKLGFIGCGNMAKAMMGGIIKNNIVEDADIMVSDLNNSALENAKNMYNVQTTNNNINVVKFADLVVLSVKPQFYATVINEIKDSVTEDHIIITIAPGQTLGSLGKAFGEDRKIVRTMPNTPALVGEGITAMCCNKNVTKEEEAVVLSILSGFGKAEVVSENLMDAVVGVSGSSPAYVFMFIEALADGAVAAGMPRDKAYTFAAQAVLGSAKMVLETGKHPGELKDMVCSPAGTTIEAVRVLEKEGLRSSVMEAVKACIEKARNL
ncbi:pyrroline-5-carboxylate reductase [Anaerosporobacter faecicola]|uniref:pyrroline-5-carboxylate reductase n=1 Tax=Anaerosporobacter faecicola TaxID=2718714 RepID=UPI00143BA606|nr:pyrroline-5-carboxylate reductase [Anaerosporobacter faecicola]